MLKKTCVFALVMVLALALANSCFPPQGSSNGTVDFIFSTNSLEQFPPQIAIWVEDETGEYVETVFVTDFIGRYGGGNRDSISDIERSLNHISALPIWAHKRNVIDTTFGILNYYPPSQEYPSYPDDIDAVSGATPQVNVVQTKSWELSTQPYGEYRCWIEVNQAYDKNEYHNYPSYRGQPSVAWNTTIVVGSYANTNMVLDYVGYGSPDGSNGNINAPDSTITTAFNLLNEINGYRFKVIYTPRIEVAEVLTAQRQ